MEEMLLTKVCDIAYPDVYFKTQVLHVHVEGLVRDICECLIRASLLQRMRLAYDSPTSSSSA